jgi:stage V sporulation protein G
MEVTDIKIYPVGEEKLRAFVSIVLDQCFRISDIKIIQGAQGRFLSMPSKRRKDGSYRDIAHPLNSDMRRCLEEAIFSRYDEMVAPAEAEQGDWQSGQQAESTGSSARHEGLAAGAVSEADAPDRLMT